VHDDYKYDRKKGTQGNVKDSAFGNDYKKENHKEDDDGGDPASIKRMGKQTSADRKAKGWGGSSEFDREIYRRDRAAGRR